MAAARRCLPPKEAEGSADASVAHTFAVDSGSSLPPATTHADDRYSAGWLLERRQQYTTRNGERCACTTP
ncbi:hypothetical protein Y032_0030g2092 [Ancylostoma ceylanicum]|uniref:Uncharacterized protein n=1 Tax=Ancylostoma ceylanicum TaxID=53326 RepID=A0A016USQ7_9BILA|nr:hypothetical protein Y032_0030g2092 [Ancylostoma ceylanicum]